MKYSAKLVADLCKEMKSVIGFKLEIYCLNQNTTFSKLIIFIKYKCTYSYLRRNRLDRS